MKIRFALLICVLLLSATGILSPDQLFAVTARPQPVAYTQPDGSSITLVLKGDEFIHWAETTDGYTIMSNRQGTYEYASLDQSGNLVFSGVQAHDAASRDAAESVFIQQLRPGLFFSESQVNQMKALKPNGSQRAPTIGGFPTTGTRKLLMILANFSNTTTVFTPADFNNYMNQTNYNGTGSFRDYYIEVSYGQLTVNTTVTMWVVLPHTHDYYGPDTKWGEFAYDAVSAANTQAAVNFAEYDNDLDGYVDGVSIIHQGEGQEASGDINDIWSHSWDLQSAGYTVGECTFDGVVVSEYTTLPEVLGTGMSTIGVMCHEFGHNLGAPDFYDTDYSTGGQYNGTGSWDLMAGGSWNGASGTKPAHPNAWIKSYFTWTNPTVLTTQQSVLLHNAQTSTDVVRYNTATANEYFLCENRQKTGFDAGLPGHGMIVYHVDGDYIAAHMENNDINAGSHQGMFPMAANSSNGSGVSTSSGSNINTTGCPWPGTTNDVTFSDVTTPNSKSWAGANTGTPLINIAENTTTHEVTFCFIACASPTDPTAFTATPVSQSQINLTWGLNTSSNPVMVAYNTTSTFGTPVNGTAYTAGGTVPGGGTVLYVGSLTAFNHPGLNSNTTYYYKAWSVLPATAYSTGVTASATTLCGTATLPFYESFNGAAIPSCWSVQNTGTGVVDKWTVQTTNNAGGTANEMRSEYQNISSGTTRLITPALNTVGLSALSLSFKHMLDAYSSGVTLKIQSSANGTTWTDEAWSVATTASNITATTINTTIASNLNNATTYIAFTVTGNLYNYDFWYIDNVSVSGTGVGPSLGVTPASQNVTAPAGSTSFTVAASGAWTASSNASWCAITGSGTGNGTLAANYSENTGVDPRTASITVSLTGATPVVVTVVQAGAAPVLSVSPSNQNVTAAAGSAPFTVTSNTSWTSTSNASWCSVTPSGVGSGTLTATYTENTTTLTRIANITVTVAGASPVTVTVTQAAANATLAVTPSNQDVPSAAGNTSFNVTSNGAWTAVSNATWCVITSSGTGNGTLSANYSENTETTVRVATITVSAAGTAPISVTVTQAGAAPSLLVTPPNQDVAALAGTTVFDVAANSTWTASSSASWCLITMSGNGSGQLWVNYGENITTVSRTAIITVTVNGISPVSVTVTQQGATPVLSVSPENQNVPATTGNVTFTVASNSGWHAASDADWCTVASSGSGNGIITADYTANMAASPRVANITVTVDGIVPVIVTVTQDFIDGMFELSSGEFAIHPNPSSGVFIINAGATFTRNPVTKDVVLEICDLSGKIVYSQRLTHEETTIGLIGISKGLYIAKLVSYNTTESCKLIIR